MEFVVYCFEVFLTEHSVDTAGQLPLTFPERLEIYVFCMHPAYIFMYAFKCCSTNINLPCAIPGHCSHLIYYPDPLEQHDRELDRLAFGAAT